jgi:DNA-directed RNA polymerase specialized sigma24 family protein
MFTSAAVATLDVDMNLDPAMVRIMVSAAAYQSNRLARSLKLHGADREDVEQEVLLILVERHRYFDASRGPWTPFVHRIANQAVQQIADRLIRDRRLYAWEAPMSDGDDDDGFTDPLDQVGDPAVLTADDLCYCGAVVRFASTLPDDLVPVLEAALAGDGSFGDVQRESGLTSSEFHRRLRELRYRLITAGLVPRRLLTTR